MKTTEKKSIHTHSNLTHNSHTHTYPMPSVFFVSIVNLKIYDYLIIYLRILNFLRFRLKFIFLFPKAFYHLPTPPLSYPHPLFSLLLLLLFFILLFCLRQINSIDDTYIKILYIECVL